MHHKQPAAVIALVLSVLVGAQALIRVEPAEAWAMTSLAVAPTPTRATGPAEPIMIPNVPRQPQGFNLSCESRSAVDVAGFWGVIIGEAEFLAALPRSDNPHKGFVGDVNAAPGSMPPRGYGIYAGPVARTLRRYGLNAQARHWLGADGLKSQIAFGRPAIVWATYEMADHPVQQWKSADGMISRIVPFEHTFIAVGYNATGFYLIDAYDAQLKHYTYAAFEAAWAKFEQMAVVVFGRLPDPDSMLDLREVRFGAHRPWLAY